MPPARRRRRVPEVSRARARAAGRDRPAIRPGRRAARRLLEPVLVAGELILGGRFRARTNVTTVGESVWLETLDRDRRRTVGVWLSYGPSIVAHYRDRGEDVHHDVSLEELVELAAAAW